MIKATMAILSILLLAAIPLSTALAQTPPFRVVGHVELDGVMAPQGVMVIATIDGTGALYSTVDDRGRFSIDIHGNAGGTVTFQLMVGMEFYPASSDSVIVVDGAGGMVLANLTASTDLNLRLTPVTTTPTYEPVQTVLVQGEQGEQGEQGVPGPAGPTGETGAQGEIGLQGEPGVAGVAGAAGVVGQPGPLGGAGFDGTDGTDGSDGIDGTRGRDGREGADGARGDAGPTGSKGSRGALGASGATGEQGGPGEPGATGPAGSGSGMMPAIALIIAIVAVIAAVATFIAGRKTQGVEEEADGAEE